MSISRRDFSKALLAGIATSQLLPIPSSSASQKLAMPGAFRGRVVSVHHPASIIANRYSADAVHQMVSKGMMELTGAPGAAEAWRVFFEPGDVVGIKLNGVGAPYVRSAPEVLQEIIAGLG